MAELAEVMFFILEDCGLKVGAANLASHLKRCWKHGWLMHL
jgi:hypothetical protein